MHHTRQLEFALNRERNHIKDRIALTSGHRYTNRGSISSIFYYPTTYIKDFTNIIPMYSRSKPF